MEDIVVRVIALMPPIAELLMQQWASAFSSNSDNTTSPDQPG
jgi:hypothetical protein